MSVRPLVSFRRVSFAYESGQPLFSELDLDLHPGFTGCVGPNGAGKTTLLHLATGRLSPNQGGVRGGGVRVYCPQRTDDPPDDLPAFLAAQDGDAYGLRGRLGVEMDWETRWSTLSHGERKRAQIGAALWRAPDLLAIDEPTNHIDADARRLLEGVLREYRGVGLLVSHDRALLDALCSHCLWLDPPRVEVHRGGFTEAAERREARIERDRVAHAHARTESARLERELVRRRQDAARSHADRSKRGIAIKDHDARSRKNAARVSGKDAQAGRLYRQLQGRASQASDRLAAIDRHKSYEGEIEFAGRRSSRALVLDLPAGSLRLGGERRVRFDALRLGSGARVGVVGPNGAGKSTLLHHVADSLRGVGLEVLFVPQEIDAARGAEVWASLRALPGPRLGLILSFLRRLGSVPERVLESPSPSPGELRKLLFALGMSARPHVVLLDEPTNHLDLPSTQALERALAACESALLLVSHDEHFLGQLTSERWRFVPDPAGDVRVENGT